MEEDLTQVSFKDPSFLQLYGLSEQNVLQYFCLSQFFDKKSINGELAMQTKFNALELLELQAQAKCVVFACSLFEICSSLIMDA
ncbi:hypothetical protein HK101_006723 [Irineochytrium annulatum]|nr:hypothetical protein HK101_006723 [Irineochytrium annulatum]